MYIHNFSLEKKKKYEYKLYINYTTKTKLIIFKLTNNF